VNIKGFFVTALSSALELGLATSEDVLHHVTPDVLATHLPRPLWARLITACVGASRVDATLVVETIGVPNLCEHVPLTILWTCISEIGTRALSGTASPRVVVSLSPPPPPTASSPALAPPPPATVGPNIPAPATGPGGEPHAALVAELEADDRANPGAPIRARPSPTRPPFRQTTTGIGRLANKRPQANAPETPATPPAVPPAASGLDTMTERGPAAAARPPRRGQTEADSFEIETNVSREPIVPVDDEQLVDWSASEETAIGPDFDRKR
jgi:hypothetical protein